MEQNTFQFVDDVLNIDYGAVPPGKPLTEEQLRQVHERLFPPSVEAVPVSVIPWSKQFLAKIRSAGINLRGRKWLTGDDRD